MKKSTSNKRALPKDQKGKPRKHIPYLDPQYLNEHWRKMLASIETPNAALSYLLTPIDHALAKQQAEAKARAERRQVIANAQHSATTITGGCLLIRPAFGQPAAL